MGVVMGLLVLSFAVWGIGDIFRGFGRSTFAKIGDTEIGIEQFRQLYRDRLQEEWPRHPDGSLAMFTRKLDLEDLMRQREA